MERLILECFARPRVFVRDYARVARIVRLGTERVQLFKGELADRNAVWAGTDADVIAFDGANESLRYSCRLMARGCVMPFTSMILPSYHQGRRHSHVDRAAVPHIRSSACDLA